MLDDGTVDLVLTDPPYEISKPSGFHTMPWKQWRVRTEFGEWDKLPDLGLLAEQFYRVLRFGGTCIVWCHQWRLGQIREPFEERKFRMFREIIWQKSNPVPINSHRMYLNNSREYAMVCVKGSKPVFNSSYDNGIYTYGIARTRGDRHPTLKPQKLFEALIAKHSNPEELVLDPFVGSGTTAAAAQTTGRRWHVGDSNPRWVEHTQNRVN